MTNSIAKWARAHPIIALFVWFFPVAWAIASVPLFVERPFGVEVPQVVFNSAATWVGGVLPVLVITWLVDGPAGLAAFGRRLVLLPKRGSVGWYALALLALPLISLMLAVIVFGPPDVTPSTAISALVNGLLLQTVLSLLIVNVWEEVQWTSFVQARLQAQRGVMLAAVIAGVLFALQHVPLFVLQGLLLIPVGQVIFAAFILLAIPFRALTFWIYNRTGSLLLVALVHAVGDAVSSGPFAPGFIPRLYPDQGAAVPFHLLALALIGLVVIAATRARLGLPARPALRAEAAAAPAAA